MAYAWVKNLRAGFSSLHCTPHTPSLRFLVGFSGASVRARYHSSIRFITNYLHLLLVAIALVFASNVHAQTKGDSVRLYRSETVLVTAPDSIGVVQGRFERSVTTNTLSRLTGEPTLSEALPLISSTVDVRRYSSLGGVAFVSIHGLPPEYTIVYREGIRTTNDQNSLSDFGRAADYSLEKISVLSPPAAMTLGGDAIGAAILLEPRHADETRFEVGTNALAYQTSGQPSEVDEDLKADFRPDPSLAISMTASNQHSDGAFPFLQSTGLIQRRENNDATVRDFSLTADFLNNPNDAPIASAARLSALFDYTTADRGAPGAATIDYRGASAFDARQTDEDLFAALKLDKPFDHGGSLEAAFAYQSQYETYSDPHIVQLGEPLNDHYLNRILSADLHASQALSDIVLLNFGVEASRNFLFSNEDFVSKGDSLITRNHAFAFAALKFTPASVLEAVVGLRSEWNALLRPQLLPQLSVSYRPYQWLEAGAAFSTGYHAPTLNELYWKIGGNPKLHEEHAASGEAYLRSSFAPIERVELSLGVSYFYSDLTDQILWLPGANNIFSPTNILNSRNQGAELNGAFRWSPASLWTIDISESYTLLSARNTTNDPAVFNREIPFTTPTSSLFTAQLIQSATGSLAFIARYRGHRFTDIGNDPGSMLEPVTTLDATATARAIPISNGLVLEPQLALKNLTNKQYTEQPGFPLPGRSIRLSVKLAFQPNPIP